jgi:FG-GAP-like repeat
MGACAGDYDNDGWVDLYVTSFGPNTLYRNTGTRSFTDVTTVARVGSSSWSTGCAFADLDRDGDLDLFVTNYVATEPKHMVRSVVMPARRRGSIVTRSILSRWRTSFSATTRTAPSRQRGVQHRRLSRERRRLTD